MQVMQGCSRGKAPAEARVHAFTFIMMSIILSHCSLEHAKGCGLPLRPCMLGRCAATAAGFLWVQFCTQPDCAAIALPTGF